jgi:transglutaminase-like putative cysteine protease
MFTKSFLQDMETGYTAQMERLGEKRRKIEALLNQCTESEAEALRCLYASMPVSDAVDYDPELFLSYAKHSAYLWEEGPFAGKVPEELFAAYVLHHRVNLENITDSRRFFYELLKDTIRGMNMEEAVIALNYWCASEATYRTTDDRTASPECVYRSAYGRCGEESTFAVSVFRSMGIPARQVYVPLWSHCDDNHAWVEVWCDGAWRFLGACEPEEILDKGWFVNAASRAMMVHSRWMLSVTPKENVIGKRGMALELNQLERYARTNNLTVWVCDKNGNKVPNAKLTFEVMNEAHFGEIASVYADNSGKGTLRTGRGSIQVTARAGGDYGEVLVNTAETTSCTIVLGNTENELEQWKEMELIAPEDALVFCRALTPEEMETGQQRLCAAEERRLAKEAAFYEEGMAEKAIADFSETDQIRSREIMKQARGNQAEIAGFLSSHTRGEWPKKWKLAILNSLCEKDYLDITADILVEHCALTACYAGTYPDEVLIPYILCPRVDHEMICSFRSFILSWLCEEKKEEIKADPSAAWTMIQEEIVSDPDLEYGDLITSAKGALTSGYGSILTKKVVCVQSLRTLGIPSRLNPADGLLEIWSNGEFHTLEKTDPLPNRRTAAITIREQAEPSWVYFQNWTIARFEKEGYQTLRLCEESGRPVFGEIALFPGKYRILTSNRLPNGNILAKKLDFELKEGEKKEIYLEQKPARICDMLVKYNLSDFSLIRENQESCRLSELVREQTGLFIWLETGKEPTEHILNEIAGRRESFQQLSGVQLFFVIRNQRVKEDPTLKHTLAELPDAEILYDEFGTDMGTLARRMYLEPEKYPLVVVIDKKMTGIYGTAGYNVGSADMILKILHMYPE